MHGPDRFDDTSTDHHRFEQRQLAQDRDARRPSTADVDEQTARELIDEFIADEMVTGVPQQQVAAFQRGWRDSLDIVEER